MLKQDLTNDRRVLNHQNLAVDKCSNYDLEEKNLLNEDQRTFLYYLHLEQIETM